MQSEAKGFIKAQLEQLQETVNAHDGSTGKNTEVRHYLCDHLGTPNALLNIQGAADWMTNLDAWGNITQEKEASNLYQSIRMYGQHEDISTSIIYNRYRYYCRNNGNYLNQDPIKFAGGYNFYLYPLNPLKFVDSLGLQAVSAGSQSPAPSDPSKRPDGREWGEGCGDSKTDKYIPDSYFGKADFLGSCGKHDSCYGTWGADKDKCDEDLKKNMKTACDDANADGKIGAPALCKLQASSYYFVLNTLNMGQPAYDAAQEDAFWDLMSKK